MFPPFLLALIFTTTATLLPTFTSSQPSPSPPQLLTLNEYSPLKPHPRIKHKVPGTSPAFYLGDHQHNHILKIKKLDLNLTSSSSSSATSSQHPISTAFTLHLTGLLTRAIGPHPRIIISISLNEYPGPSIEMDLCSSHHHQQQQQQQLLPGLEIYQKGRRICPPGEGEVEMIYSVSSEGWMTGFGGRMMKKGWYTVFVEIYGSKSEEDGGGEEEEVTAFVGDVWCEGGVGDGWGGWRGRRSERREGERERGKEKERFGGERRGGGWWEL